MVREPGIFRSIFKNFINSLKPRKISGDFRGKDQFGNKFYEIPAEPSIGKRKASRWFVPQQKDDFQREIPAEWESWLRGRRNDPPTEEEISKSALIAQMKKDNAAEIERKDPTPKPKPVKETITPFPKYNEYEEVPGRAPKDER